LQVFFRQTKPWTCSTSPGEFQLSARSQCHTCPFDITGNPTIALRDGFAKCGMSIGFQRVAPHLNEDVLIQAGVAFRQAATWRGHHPVRL